MEAAKQFLQRIPMGEGVDVEQSMEEGNRARIPEKIADLPPRAESTEKEEDAREDEGGQRVEDLGGVTRVGDVFPQRGKRHQRNGAG